MNATPIVYAVRVSESAYMELSPEEIAELMKQGLQPDIRIMAA